MILISHRGNTKGPEKEKENTINHIDKSISEGYLCEVDAWIIDNKFYLSHDNPKNNGLKVEQSFFIQRAKDLIIHCKNLDALIHFAYFDIIHYFWHQNDDYTMTSKNWIWCYPGKKGTIIHPSICVMPELHNQVVNANFTGVCSDYIERYK